MPHRALHKWAREDDPLGYAELHHASTIPAIVIENWEKLDRGLAVIAHHQLKEHIKVTSAKPATRSIYYFDKAECRWRQGVNDSLHRMVSASLEETLRDLEAYFGAKARVEENESQRKFWDDKRAGVRERLNYLWKHGGISNVTNSLVPYCVDESFEATLDSHAHLLGVKNGVVDLRTGRLRQRAPEDLIFTVLEEAYDPEADSRDWEAALLAAMADNAEMAAFLHRLMGYGITGETSEEVFVIFTGGGRNSKGLLTQTVEKVMGAFFVSMNSGMICERQISNADAERGKLFGKRVAVFNELKPGERLKTDEVKLLSGGDGIPARRLYKDPITLIPRHLSILSTNHMPELGGDVKTAMMERLLVIHFPVTFTDLLDGEAPSSFRRQADRGLKRRLEENLKGVLTWLVKGAMAWYATQNLKRTAPPEVTDFSRKYFEEQDKLGVFLSDECLVGDGYKVPSMRLLEEYNKAVGRAGPQLNEKLLAKAMAAQGFQKANTKAQGYPRGMCYLGVALKNDTSDTSSPLERAFRASLEARGVAMPKARPEWLKNPKTGATLELDFYDEEQRVAIEYDGAQHHEFPNAFHKSRAEFEEQVARDRWKDAQCAAMGVQLVRIRATGNSEQEAADAVDEMRQRCNWSPCVEPATRTELNAP